MLGRCKILIISIILMLKVLVIKWGMQIGVQILSGEDKYFYSRGFSNFCQYINSSKWRTLPFKKSETIYSKRLCQLGAKRTIMLYLDSVPFDLFTFPHLQRLSESMDKRFGHTFIVKHYGITDSGPSFSNFFTGKIANKYEGLITGIDNFFYQIFNAGQKIKAHGYRYPIREMIGTGYFEEYTESQEGLSKVLCPGFLNIYSLYEAEKNHNLGFINSQKDMESRFQEFFLEFKKELSHRKAQISHCLQRVLDGGSILRVPNLIKRKLRKPFHLRRLSR